MFCLPNSCVSAVALVVVGESEAAKGQCSKMCPQPGSTWLTLQYGIRRLSHEVKGSQVPGREGTSYMRPCVVLVAGREGSVSSCRLRRCLKCFFLARIADALLCKGRVGIVRALSADSEGVGSASFLLALPMPCFAGGRVRIVSALSGRA